MPLFPGLNLMQDQLSGEAAREGNKFKKEKDFIDDYTDRRATAKYSSDSWSRRMVVFEVSV